MAAARRKLVTLAARKQVADARRKLVSSVGEAAVCDEAFSRFYRISAKVEQSEAEAEAMLELAGAELPGAEVDLDVEAELQELKRKKRLKAS